MVFILFCKVTSGGKNVWVIPKSYVMLCNSCGRFWNMLPNWVTFFIKVDEIENFKVETCCTEGVELGNITF